MGRRQHLNTGSTQGIPHTAWPAAPLQRSCLAQGAAGKAAAPCSRGRRPVGTADAPNLLHIALSKGLHVTLALAPHTPWSLGCLHVPKALKTPTTFRDTALCAGRPPRAPGEPNLVVLPSWLHPLGSRTSRLLHIASHSRESGPGRTRAGRPACPLSSLPFRSPHRAFELPTLPGHIPPAASQASPRILPHPVAAARPARLPPGSGLAHQCLSPTCGPAPHCLTDSFLRKGKASPARRPSHLPSGDGPEQARPQQQSQYGTS